ncbi:non-ribosomal peptide synthetase [Cellulomonas phragmiteti]|uniref:Phenyloxazoline synthase MbtB n=1 Tax=Cellulomonas phragmiteti TaxID=478780 RepID=A0ABQ4DMK6_9CELL|nr:non-ribosomal peptide synthetase [Cellulomonas phragmiteti]GIG40584.1 non-ribosomal peptide synthetase [Cellulomonas phragmiteti]
MSQTSVEPRTSVRDQVAAVLGTDTFGDEDDLFDHGIDSLGLIRLVGRWRDEGHEVTFEDLAADATVTAWGRLLAAGPSTVRPVPADPADPADPVARDTAPPTSEPFDLATMQHAYWVGRGDEQPLGGVAAHFYTEFDGHGLDPDRLARALDVVVAAHPMLRVRIDDDGRQRYGSTGSPLRVQDLRHLGPAAAAEALTALRDEGTHRRMDVRAGHVLDVALTLLADGRTRLHVDLDMVAADALSLRVLLDDLGAAYRGRPRSAPRYDYATALRDRALARAAETDRARRWWQDRLPALPPAPALPTVQDATAPTPPGSPFTRSTRLHHRLSPERARVLTERSRAAGVTPAAALATAFALTLAAWSAEPRFSLNLPLFDRPPLHPDVDRVVGDFSSSVLLAVDTGQDRTFTAHARALQGELHAAVDHGAWGGVEVLRDLARLHGRPTVPSPVVYTSAIGLGPLFSEDVQDTFGPAVHIISQGPQVWLDAQVTELDGGLLLNWDLREHLFVPGTAQAAFAAYRDLVDLLVDDPATWDRHVVAPVPAATDGTRDRPAVDLPAPAARTLHAAFLEHAQAAPDAVALVDVDGTPVTYGQLAQDALRVAGAVARAVPAGSTVALTLPRGARQVAALLGVLAAGCAYLPAGDHQPPARRRAILQVARPALLLVDPADGDDSGDAPHGTPVLRISDALAGAPGTTRPCAPDDVAYVLFTSGSTGVPKGVEVPHGGAAHTVDVLAAVLGTGPQDRTLALAETDFDMSVVDLLLPLSTGGAAVLVASADRRDATTWARAAAEHGVTVVNCVPTLLDMLLTVVESGDAPAPPLRAVLLGGDRVGTDLPARLRAVAPGARFLALGGMTEAAIHSTLLEVDRVDPAWTCVPWGRPLPGVRCRVVDVHGHDRPDGVPGELWVGGAGLARGYRGAPEVTADRFVEVDGRRWYRAGDLARYAPDGTLEFLGRTDHQVKVNGVRVETGEVEAALRSHPDVDGAVVVVLDAPAPTLAAVVTPAAGRAPDARSVRDHTATLLPPTMVPAVVEVLERMPLTPNAKPDRAAVVVHLRTRSAGQGAAGESPRGAAEHELATVWCELLDVPRVSRTDAFFALGGDSLLATRLVATLRARGHGDVTVADVFVRPVLADLATRLAGGAPDAPAPEPAPVLTHDAAHRHDPFDATGVQQAYLTGRDPEFTLGGVGTYHYTELDGVDVDLDRVRRALDRLVARHDMLRAVFDADGRQRVLPDVPPLGLPVVEADPADPRPALAALHDAMSHQVLDPTRWPLLDVRAVRWTVDGRTHVRLGVGLDYLVLDALSIMTFYRELDALYRDPDATLPAVDVTFRDYLIQRQTDPERERRALEHWSSRVRDLPPAPTLPLAVDPGQVRRPRFTRRTDHLDAATWSALTAAARAAGLTPSTLLLACYGEVLATWSGRDGVAVTLTLFNREDVHPHVHRVLGDFTTLSLAGYERAPGTGPADAARALHRRLGEDLDHRDVSAERVLREISRRDGTAHAGVPVVFTSSLGLGDGNGLDLPGGFVTRVRGLSQSPQVHLDNQVLESAGGLEVSWDAVEELFAPGVLDAMFAAYTALLRGLADAGADAWPRLVGELLPPDQRSVRTRVNATDAPAPRGTLHAAFFERVSQRPDAPALVAATGTLSHAEVADRALRVAAGLRARGVAPGDAVAVHLPKGADQVCATLGVLAAGAVHVPVGVSQPPARRARVHAAARTVLVVGDDPGAARSCTVAELLAHEPLPAPVPVAAGSTAYVIFTSGSSGEPKGVEVTHAAALNTVADVVARYGIGPQDRVLALSALAFDLSVLDVLGVLGAGGALVLPTEDERTDAHRWLALCRTHGVTLWNTVPALLDMLLLAADGTPLPLRLALVSGDWVGTDLADRLAVATDGRARLVALGGATEASVWSNAHDGGRAPAGWTSVPYGLPLTNQRFRVVDAHGRDCPDWVPGELWIGGAGVAVGYRGDPARTAEKFVTTDDGRWYRTGDLGRYRPDGLLEFLGRADRQVKIGGHRLELGEVEAALVEHPAVRRAAVVAVGERADRRLVGFVVPADAPDAAGPGDALPDVLTAHLRAHVPAHAVPGTLHVLPAMPLTANGKVDTAALTARAVEHAAAPAASVEPADDVERSLARTWADLLGAPVTDRTANFFALGGTSLLALRMLTQVRTALAPDVSTRDFLTDPTLAALADQVRAASSEDVVTGVL